MITPTPRTTLAVYISLPQVTPLVQMKGLFSKHPYLTFSSVLYAGVWLFGQGAVIAYSRNSQKEILAKLWANPGGESESCDHLIATTKEIVEGYGQPPESFIEFFTNTVGRGLGASNLTPEKMKELSSHTVRLGMAMEWMETWFRAGLGLGLTFPDLVEKMWRQSYEGISPEDQEQARQVGMEVPENITLEEMVQIVLTIVAAYAREYVPEVIEPLKLSL